MLNVGDVVRVVDTLGDDTYRWVGTLEHYCGVESVIKEVLYSSDGRIRYVLKNMCPDFHWKEEELILVDPAPDSVDVDELMKILRGGDAFEKI